MPDNSAAPVKSVDTPPVKSVDSPSKLDQRLFPKPTSTIHFKSLRDLTRGRPVVPVQREIDWLLPFAPKDGRSRAVQPGGEAWLATGVALVLPLGVVARILYPARPGHPGQCLVAMELDDRHNGMEISVKVRNESDAAALYFQPGEHYFVVRLARLEALDLQPAPA